jgi:hypothetical protein
MTTEIILIGLLAQSVTALALAIYYWHKGSVETRALGREYAAWMKEYDLLLQRYERAGSPEELDFIKELE